MDADLQMARGEVEGGYNLAIGEPVVLQDRLFIPEYRIRGPFQYPTLDGDPALMRHLRAMYPGEEIVVTIGAKQALSAAFYAFKKVEKKADIYHKVPYWPSYRMLAAMAGLGFVKDQSQVVDSTIVCVTSPNNPDGVEAVDRAVDVWDAVYASRLYGWSGRSVDARVRVYSAAKLLGLSGARVGWLVTKDKDLADYARLYVELTTSGVSLPAQRVVAEALDWHERDWLAQFSVDQARADVVTNGKLFNQILGKYCQCVRGVPVEGTGMFAYFKVKDELIEVPGFHEAAQRARVALVTGLACGETYSGWFRMSMGQRPMYTEAALIAVEEKIRDL